jgi:hypothetical protein
VQRARVTMDELVREDDSIGYNSRVSILLPTNGEKLDVVMKVCHLCIYIGIDNIISICRMSLHMPQRAVQY